MYISLQHASLEECITQFLATFNPQKYPLYCMALAVAGPVADNAAKITNLVSMDWNNEEERDCLSAAADAHH